MLCGEVPLPGKTNERLRDKRSLQCRDRPSPLATAMVSYVITSCNCFHEVPHSVSAGGPPTFPCIPLLHFGTQAIMLAKIRYRSYIPSRRRTMKLEKSKQAPMSLPMSPPCLCTHGRLISDSVSVTEHEAGMVRCVECGGIIPNPHHQGESKET